MQTYLDELLSSGVLSQEQAEKLKLEALPPEEKQLISLLHSFFCAKAHPAECSFYEDSLNHSTLMEWYNFYQDLLRVTKLSTLELERILASINSVISTFNIQPHPAISLTLLHFATRRRLPSELSNLMSRTDGSADTIQLPKIASSPQAVSEEDYLRGLGPWLEE